MLNSSIFNRELKKIWQMNIGIFSAKWNAQLPRFVSWMIQPHAFAIYAFSLNWSRISGSAFPPFALIARCLAKVSQTWFPLLLQMARDVPRVLRFRSDLLTSCIGAPHTFMSHNSLILSVLKLSGRPMSNSITNVLQYISDLHSAGKAYSTINILRSMLSSTLESIEGFPIGQHCLVKRLMQGCFHSKPPTSCYSAMWDPEVVLVYMA